MEAEKDQSNPYTNFEASERTLRVHTNKGRRDDTKQEQFSAKKMKVTNDLGDETFFMDDGKKKKIEDDLTGKTFFMDEVKSARKGDVHELRSDTEEDKVQEIEAIPLKKISASIIKETSKSSQIFHGHTPQRLASPMKTSKIQTPTQPMGGAKFHHPDLVKEEIEKARLKPEQNKKDEEKEEVEEDK